ncbi:methylated-DNA-[protein]-cysteine S-methyltransferase [Oceanobacillus limi]|uniref:Methylated-DNA--protein-cysteine methyltransferase n=1 Tax=Oceanobacillus limi TaxID=930131 RepID=A0A1H9YG65_9BACI|nr:methylated-DNA--[protein]-cysteine S-methyltransferase [Oceanobacillus limi]SES67923.1 methylated-DNA-[protein]-cysteine S-methyltransferase [Oceanobacillus limi]
MDLYYDEVNTPIGPLLVVSDGEHILRIDYGSMEEREVDLQNWAKRYIGQVTLVKNAERVSEVQRQLQAYFSHERNEFSIPFRFHGTPFQKKVWNALYELIPFGKTVSYKEIATAIGQPKAVRAVGGAVNKNPFSVIVPCHRVVGANGKMVGYNGGLDKKEYLLNHESIIL